MSLTFRSALPFLASMCVVAIARGASPPAPPAGSSPPVLASSQARAANLREQGNQAMLDMRYVDALSAYEQSLSLAPEYLGALYSMARAHQLLGEYPEALTALERFEREASPEVKSRVGRLEQLFAELRARVGTLHLSCNVLGARILIRDKLVGTTPLSATRLPAGSATLEVELDGFFTEKRQIVVPSSGALSLELTLHARSKVGLLIVRTNPAGALVSVDGRKQGSSSPSIELALPAGSHRVTALREGYDEASVPVVLKAGSVRELTMPLEKSVPLTSRWWFWTGTAAVLAGGAVLTIALLTERPADRGSLMPNQISAPLRF